MGTALTFRQHQGTVSLPLLASIIVVAFHFVDSGPGCLQLSIFCWTLGAEYMLTGFLTLTRTRRGL